MVSNCRRFVIFFLSFFSFLLFLKRLNFRGDEDRSSLSFVPKELLQYCSENLISLRDLMNKFFFFFFVFFFFFFLTSFWPMNFNNRVPLLSSARQSFSPNVSEESNRGGEQNKNWQELKVLLSQSIEVVNLFLLVYEVGFETIFSRFTFSFIFLFLSFSLSFWDSRFSFFFLKKKVWKEIIKNNYVLLLLNNFLQIQVLLKLLEQWPLPSFYMILKIIYQ